MELNDASMAVQNEIMPAISEWMKPPEFKTLGECAEKIQSIMMNQIGGYIQIGWVMNHARSLCEHGEFTKFLEAYDISKTVAYEHIRVFERFKYNFPRAVLLGGTVLYMLSDKKVPDKIINHCISMAEKGVEVRCYDVQSLIAAHKENKDAVGSVEIDPDLYIEKIQESIKQMNMQALRFEKVGGYDYDALKQSSQEVVRMINKLSKCNV